MSERTDVTTGVDEWLAALAADTPTPGGGGAAAVAVSAGAALAVMAARRSGRHVSDAAKVTERADHLRAEALGLASADAVAYQRLLEVRRGGDQSSQYDAFRAATEVPLRIAEIGAEVAGVCNRLGDEGNPNLRGDAVTGALLAEAGAVAAATLVEINVKEGGLPGELSRRGWAAADQAGAATVEFRADAARA